jgi:hypothetical protein
MGPIARRAEQELTNYWKTQRISDPGRSAPPLPGDAVPGKKSEKPLRTSQELSQREGAMAQRGKRNADAALLLALACGATVEAAAHAAGLSPATAYRRLKDPAFCQRLQNLRADMVQRTAGTLTAAAGEGVKALLALVKEGTPPAVRLGAARAVLEIGMKLRQQTELEQRIAALEAAQQAQSRPGTNGRAS